MEFYDVVKERYSCRNYLDKEVEPEVLNRIFEAVRQAPSARNIQEWKFYIVQDPAKKMELRKAAKNQPFVSQAPILVVGAATVTDYTMTCGYPAYIIDLSIALEHLALAATNEGLGTCWIGAYYRDEVKEILNLPANEEPVQLMTLGYPADELRPKTRKSPDEILFRID